LHGPMIDYFFKMVLGIFFIIKCFKDKGHVHWF